MIDDDPSLKPPSSILTSTSNKTINTVQSVVRANSRLTVLKYVDKNKIRVVR